MPTANLASAHRGERPAVVQVVRGIGWAGTALLGLATAFYGMSLFLLGGNVGDGVATHTIVRLLGVALVVTSANIVRVALKGRAVLRAVAIDVVALVGVLAILWLLVGPK